MKGAPVCSNVQDDWETGFNSFSIHLVVTFYLKSRHLGSVSADATLFLWVGPENLKKKKGKVLCWQYPAIPPSGSASLAWRRHWIPKLFMESGGSIPGLRLDLTNITSLGQKASLFLWRLVASLLRRVRMECKVVVAAESKAQPSGPQSALNT